MSSTDPLHGLFKERAPVAAARQLAVVLAWLTECQLAGLEAIAAKRGTPKSELARQKRICEDAVRQCSELGLAAGVKGLRGLPCPRLDEALNALSPSPAREMASEANEHAYGDESLTEHEQLMAELLAKANAQAGSHPVQDVLDQGNEGA